MRQEFNLYPVEDTGHGPSNLHLSGLFPPMLGLPQHCDVKNDDSINTARELVMVLAVREKQISNGYPAGVMPGHPVVEGTQ